METRQEIKPHPLLLYPVLSRILRHVDYNSLRVMRRVCRTWNQESYRFLSRKAKISIDGEEVLRAFLTSDLHPPCESFELIKLPASTLLPFLISRGDSITSLSLRECHFSNLELRRVLFDLLPNLVKLEIVLSERPAANSGFEISRSEESITNSLCHPVDKLWNYKSNRNSSSSSGGNNNKKGIKRNRHSFVLFSSSSKVVIKSRCLPMYIGLHQGSLPNLRSLVLVGDFSYRSDVIFDVMRNARNLEHIAARKRRPAEDDLFGTWFSEICLALKLPCIKCLELESPLTWSQATSLLSQSFPLARISLNFTHVQDPASKLIFILDKFKKTLESAEFGVEQVPDTFVDELLSRFKKSQVWIAVHSECDTKLVFPAHSYVMLENRL